MTSSSSNGTIGSRRRRWQKFSWLLWKPSVGPDVKSTARQSSSNTVLGDDDDTESLTGGGDGQSLHPLEETHQNPGAEDDPSEQRQLATPQQWLDHYQAQLEHALDWTERANLCYKLGNLYAQCHDYAAATRAFEQEARILSAQQGIPRDALVPIYKSLARLWQVRQPQKALSYYQMALQHAAQADDVQSIRHAMGRLYFQTGNLERAMQVSIGKLK